MAAEMAQADGPLLAPRRNELGVEAGLVRKRHAGGTNPATEDKGPKPDAKRWTQDRFPSAKDALLKGTRSKDPLEPRGFSATTTKGH